MLVPPPPAPEPQCTWLLFHLHMSWGQCFKKPVWHTQSHQLQGSGCRRARTQEARIKGGHKLAGGCRGVPGSGSHYPLCDKHQLPHWGRPVTEWGTFSCCPSPVSLLLNNQRGWGTWMVPAVGISWQGCCPPIISVVRECRAPLSVTSGSCIKRWGVYCTAKWINSWYLACHKFSHTEPFQFPVGVLLRARAWSSHNDRVRKTWESSDIAQTVCPSYTFSAFSSLPQTVPRNTWSELTTAVF